MTRHSRCNSTKSTTHTRALDSCFVDRLPCCKATATGNSEVQVVKNKGYSNASVVPVMKLITKDGRR